jgi:hypothetical protein
MFVDYTAIAGIICGTGMITLISLAIIRALSRKRRSANDPRLEAILHRLDAIEAKVVIHDDEVQQLQEENRFLNRLLKHDEH